MVRTLPSTPAADGFWMPSELEPHAGCWMLWPERLDNWRDGAQPAQQAFAAVAAAIAQFEPVTVGVSAPQLGRARALLPAAVRTLEMAHDDCWMRDVGPTFVVNAQGGLRGVDWPFNAWGGLYHPWDQDDAVAQKVLAIENCDRYRAPLINEGGAVHVDGEGTALVTEECLLNPNRNPSLTRAQIETHLEAYLGVRAVIWLGKGMVNDETDGHIDELACFARPAEVCLAWTDDVHDPQHRVSRDAWERLREARDARGRRLRITKLPLPGPLVRSEAEAAGVLTQQGTRARPAGERLAASYVNFYAANGGIVMPLLDVRTDELAARGLAALFPDRRVLGVPAREILLGGGGIHCITQQVPARAIQRPSASRAALSSQLR